MAMEVEKRFKSEKHLAAATANASGQIVIHHDDKQRRDQQN